MPIALLLELVAAVVHGGAPPEAALRSVGEALLELGDQRGEGLLLAAGRIGGSAPPAVDPPPAATSAGRLLAVVEESLLLAVRSGLPPTALVRRAAEEERRRQLSEQLRAIRRLEVLLVIPAGLCLLPAFVLLGIVPLVIDLIVG
jgi:tight adherence protein B